MLRHIFGILCLTLSIGIGASAQETGPQTNLSRSSLDLVMSTVDLMFRVETMAGQTQDLQIQKTGLQTRILLPADILFDFDKADIRPTAERALHQLGQIIHARARGTVTIEGHTDSKGKPSYNQKLSERRARSVEAWLVTREGLRGVKFAIKGYGATKPVAPNTKPDGSDDPEGRQKNRRVEVVFGGN